MQKHKTRRDKTQLLHNR